jgi:hypothetical protein
MKQNLDHDNAGSAGLQRKPVRIEFIPSTATAVLVAGTFQDWQPAAKTGHSSGNGHWRVAFQLMLLGLILTGACARGGSIVIGYTNCLAVTNYSQAQMSQIGQLKWYFAHASVGDCMKAGIASLHQLNANFYPLQSVSSGATPPATTQTNVIYEYMRGNPGWQPKFDTFQTYVTNGWRFPKVNLAMDKLCFIDPTANLNYYLNSMLALEAAFPQTVFVYTTMPLTTTNSSWDNYVNDNNYLRNVYNDGLRSWISTNNRVLFDIADIEAHDSNGVLCTFTYSNRVCQRECTSYSSDGGHPDSLYAEQMLARGFYALAGTLFTVDRDGDGVSDGQELIAGTIPTDSRSVFKLASFPTVTPGAIVLQWNSSSNRFYTLQRGTPLIAPGTFTNLLVDVPATSPMNSYTDSPPKIGSFSYRISVRQ